MIQGIIFDLDDTLYDYQLADQKAQEKLCDFCCESFNITDELFYEAYSYGRKVTKDTLDDCAAQHNRLLYCQRACEYLGINALVHAVNMYNVYWESFLSTIRVREGVTTFLSMLNRKKIPVVICTDLTAHIQYRKIERLGIQELVDYIVTSEEVGVEKPNEKMFLACLKKMNLNATQVCFIGDSLKKDIGGANTVGMRTIWYRNNFIQDEVSSLAMFSITDFCDERLFALCE